MNTPHRSKPGPATPGTQGTAAPRIATARFATLRAAKPTPAALPRRRLLQAGTAWALAALLPTLSAVAGATEAPPIGATPPPEVARELAGAQLQGTAKLRFLGMDIYQARLWSLTPLTPASYAQTPFALELSYARSLSGRLIAERSLKEMQRQGKQDSAREQAWLQAMVQAFPDVKAGDRITGLHVPGVGARFWFNGQSRPEVRDADFSRAFFGIWLSEASSEPAMRKNLLGQQAP